MSSSDSVNPPCPFAQSIPIHRSTRCTLVSVIDDNNDDEIAATSDARTNDKNDDEGDVDKSPAKRYRRTFIHRFESTSFTQSPQGSVWNESMRKRCANFAPFSLQCSYTSSAFKWPGDGNVFHITNYVPRNRTMFWRLPKDIIDYWRRFVDEAKQNNGVLLWPTHKSVADGIVQLVDGGEPAHSFVLFRPITFSDTINDMAIGIGDLILSTIRNLTVRYASQLETIDSRTLIRSRPDNMYCNKLFARRLSCSQRAVDQHFACAFKSLSNGPDTRLWYVVAKCLFGQHNSYIHSVCCRRPVVTYSSNWMTFFRALVDDRLESRVGAEEEFDVDAEFANELQTTVYAKRSVGESRQRRVARRSNVNALTQLHKLWLQEMTHTIRDAVTSSPNNDTLRGSTSLRRSGD